MKNQIVPKTEQEIKMNNFYMDLIRLDQPIPQNLIDKFNKDKEQIRLENPIYNTNLNQRGMDKYQKEAKRISTELYNLSKKFG